MSEELQPSDLPVATVSTDLLFIHVCRTRENEVIRGDLEVGTARSCELEAVNVFKDCDVSTMNV